MAPVDRSHQQGNVENTEQPLSLRMRVARGLGTTRLVLDGLDDPHRWYSVDGEAPRAIAGLEALDGAVCFMAHVAGL